MEKIKNYPVAKICIGKNEIKHYVNVSGTYYEDKTAYLKNGTEFSIELFNPTTENVVCVFEINGSKDDLNGLILAPGQRIFLDRYLSENKKFLFETYKVEAGNKQVEKAIKNNGIVNVQFFKESKPSITYGTTFVTNYPNPWEWYNNIYCSSPNVSVSNTGYRPRYLSKNSSSSLKLSNADLDIDTTAITTHNVNANCIEPNINNCY